VLGAVVRDVCEDIVWCNVSDRDFAKEQLLIIGGSNVCMLS